MEWRKIMFPGTTPMRQRTYPVIAVFLILLSLSLTGCSRSTTRMSIGDRFMVSDDDLITDILTGIQWRVGPDCNIDWEGAKEWIDDLGADWEMPDYDQLIQLWNAGITITTWGPFINSGRFVWCLHFDGEGKSHKFSFIPIDPLGNHYIQQETRVFAVRPLQSSRILARRTFRSWTL